MGMRIFLAFIAALLSVICKISDGMFHLELAGREISQIATFMVVSSPVLLGTAVFAAIVAVMPYDKD
ncbi:hypothetical protein A3I99_04175 [Candidatus Kaiserbacteria bacterium RIFCSPLOWO2_02_FULL_45_11b]|uniref:Uncharacterized protein n=1 Tax=Candidatus Kaiserbacteria bacterium RIFCSPLOWO2_12_FULL_45_26 TaxID=1798525 RepID=A0A1F6FHI5_9BACT|nr:MAG: hypothetical protein A2Z56_00660 [Candidatus Kaiserbacteria bacterium RIFCSPHIGHO2_12_45_16]OGG70106.1 MAG: hypothetical protein A2929_03390 [Candidatus Kaiserbacteria bacterium RIFCSPLOWO2_01_FULL_45_25]OGG83782.1 MAG: hypothetical protein A3I99_04175 [Candidatus Kaiserbacteria bacterium RIFCSPLOWO2_02_FULL_45_11b]OGG85276.1 MAG: hypothetical protein A3G90_04450 [Candidatus Kaiserbacteria bacterium RIFCSPLOWO2_12_FULL_45_26]